MAGNGWPESVERKHTKTKHTKKMKAVHKFLHLVLTTTGLLASGMLMGQTAFEKEFSSRITKLTRHTNYKPVQLYPNNALQGMMIPSGWGGYGSAVYAEIGAVYPQLYSNKLDAITSVGFCFGNPERGVNLALGINMTSPRSLQNFSGNFMVSRSLGRGSSLAVGGYQLLASEQYSDAPEPTFYLVYSHSVQSLPSSTPGVSKLTYTLGVGSGRYFLKSEFDQAAGKGRFGTAFFGGLSYELKKNLNLNAEWDGLNLGLSLGISPAFSPFSFGVGVTNLTELSGDKPLYAITVGYAKGLNNFFKNK